tara:strand:- start:13421 stop:14578 length:1158 start_codon:yes stop_codon:yes gene_type:complete
MNVIIVFFILFGGKIGFLDINFIVLFYVLIRQKNLVFKLGFFEKKILFFFISLSVYSLIISIINGGVEIYWVLKFLKASIFLILLSITINSVKINFFKLNNLVISAVFIHSLIIIATVISSPFRDFVYGLTGYEHRSLLGLRSPGITISFNSTAIVHVIALYVFLFKEHKFKRIKRVIVFGVIFISLLFLGRTIAFSGIGIIFLTGIIKRKKIIIGIGFFLIIFIPSTFEFINDNKNLENFSPRVEILLKNYKKFVSPFMGDDSNVNILTYQQNTLGSHYYFSNSITTLIFGNSRSGHVGLTDYDKRGETDSDLGFINSINANGIIVTLFLYLFYVFLIKMSYKSDIVLVLSLLTVILTFKETGFLTSHATPLLFFYVFVIRKNK